jgi:hypothetical protein
MERVSNKITDKLSSIERLGSFKLLPVSKIVYYREIINAQLFNQIIFDVIANVRVKIDYKL